MRVAVKHEAAWRVGGGLRQRAAGGLETSERPVMWAERVAR